MKLGDGSRELGNTIRTLTSVHCLVPRPSFLQSWMEARLRIQRFDRTWADEDGCLPLLATDADFSKTRFASVHQTYILNTLRSTTLLLPKLHWPQHVRSTDGPRKPGVLSLGVKHHQQLFALWVHIPHLGSAAPLIGDDKSSGLTGYDILHCPLIRISGHSPPIFVTS